MKELLGLSYSRDQEAQADAYSVRYLSTSDYGCDGTAGFFIKLKEAGDDVGIPEILSDHPDSGSRIREIQKEAKRLGLQHGACRSFSMDGVPREPPERRGHQRRTRGVAGRCPSGSTQFTCSPKVSGPVSRQ